MQRAQDGCQQAGAAGQSQEAASCLVSTAPHAGPGDLGVIAGPHAPAGVRAALGGAAVGRHPAVAVAVACRRERGGGRMRGWASLSSAPVAAAGVVRRVHCAHWEGAPAGTHSQRCCRARWRSRAWALSSRHRTPACTKGVCFSQLLDSAAHQRSKGAPQAQPNPPGWPRLAFSLNPISVSAW